MFEFSNVVDYMVNPVNLVGVSGAGLALEFKNRAPEYIEPYKKACLSKELRVGTIQVIEEINQPWGIMNLPTKRFWADPSNPDDIKRTLIALRETLMTDKYQYASIGLPMLGCGCGKQDYDIVEPMMDEYLSDLDATVILSMSPTRTEKRPRYLMIAGPPTFGEVESEQEIIQSTIEKAMESWETSLGEYDGIITGGTEGCDTYLGGTDFNKDVEKTYIFQKTGKPSLVIKPNRARNGVGAHLYSNTLECELADDIILFKPLRHNNNRMSAMQVWINQDKDKRLSEGKIARRVGIFGDKEITLPHENLLVNVTTNIPDGKLDDENRTVTKDDLPY